MRIFLKSVSSTSSSKSSAILLFSRSSSLHVTSSSLKLLNYSFPQASEVHLNSQVPRQQDTKSPARALLRQQQHQQQQERKRDVDASQLGHPAPLAAASRPAVLPAPPLGHKCYPSESERPADLRRSREDSRDGHNFHVTQRPVSTRGTTPNSSYTPPDRTAAHIAALSKQLITSASDTPTLAPPPRHKKVKVTSVVRQPPAHHSVAWEKQCCPCVGDSLRGGVCDCGPVVRATLGVAAQPPRATLAASCVNRKCSWRCRCR